MNPWLKAKLTAVALIVGKSVYDDLRGFATARREWREASAKAIREGVPFTTPIPAFHWELWLERIGLAVLLAVGAVFGLDAMEQKA